MDEWGDFNGDGYVDPSEQTLADQMLCGSREESMELFGDPGFFGNEIDDGVEDDYDYESDDLDLYGLDRDELEMMSDDERREALEDAGLDPDDYDFECYATSTVNKTEEDSPNKNDEGDKDPFVTFILVMFGIAIAIWLF